jgi:RNA polymerase-binding transcription factor DksA
VRLPDGVVACPAPYVVAVHGVAEAVVSAAGKAAPSAVSLLHGILFCELLVFLFQLSFVESWRPEAELPKVFSSARSGQDGIVQNIGQVQSLFPSGFRSSPKKLRPVDSSVTVVRTVPLFSGLQIDWGNLMRARTKNSHLEDCRTILLAKLEELINTLHTQDFEGREIEDVAGIGLPAMAKDFTHPNMEVELRTLAEVELSLKRLDNGAYGVCGGRGAEIPAARMKALPWTRVCVSCAGGGGEKRSVANNAYEPK